MKIIMVVYPGMTPLDLFGPLQVWSGVPEVDIEFAWKTLEPALTDTGLAVVPTHTFETAAEAPDVLFIGGGVMPTMALLQDEEMLSFLRSRGEKAGWVTSVCTGSLVLGAAGLLDGYKATTHWCATPMLEQFGAEYTPGRYVIDRNRATGGGVTAGIDFGLALLAQTHGDDFAKTMQLGLEYAPAPPFDCGTPDKAPQELVERVMGLFAEGA